MKVVTMEDVNEAVNAAAALYADTDGESAAWMVYDHLRQASRAALVPPNTQPQEPTHADPFGLGR